MLRKMMSNDYNEIMAFLGRDNLRNYFIKLSLLKGMASFEKIMGQYIDGDLVALLFLRASGNLQMYAEGNEDSGALSAYIAGINFGKLMSTESFCDRLEANLFQRHDSGAYLAELTQKYKLVTAHDDLKKDVSFTSIEALKIEDLDEVVDIYKEIFSGFSKKEVMTQKLSTGRGRGYVLRVEGKIASVVQTEFEDEESAVIVAVGTDPKFQGRGYASKLLVKLCHDLNAEGKSLFLQYDNINAGRIYKRLGFEDFDRLGHYYKVK